MKITQHGDYLYQLTRWWVANCHLVREADGFTLIDTNLPGCATHIMQAAEELDAPIRRIVLTHAHNDHVASLDALHEALPEVEVYCSQRTARFLAGERELDLDEPQVKLRGGYTTCQTQPDHLLADGDSVESLVAIFTPGHTPGHMAFIDQRDNTLIAGDVLTNIGGLAVAGVLRWLFPFPALATWHKPTALESAQKLLTHNPSRLAVGHGAVVESPQAAIEKAIAEAEQKFS